MADGGNRDSRAIPLDASPTNYPGQNPNPKKIKTACECLCAHVCVCPNLIYPGQFLEPHSDRYNDQWQSELQLRAGISVPSQPIRAEVLRNREGQTESCESTNKHMRSAQSCKTNLCLSLVDVSICLQQKGRRGNARRNAFCSKTLYEKGSLQIKNIRMPFRSGL